MKAEEIAKAIGSALDNVTSKALEKLNADDDKKNDDKKVVINVDTDSLVKAITSNLNPDNSDDEEDADDYEDQYDEMNDKELRKSCSDKNIPVFSKTTSLMMKKKLRTFDDAEAKKSEDANNTDDKKEKDIEDEEKLEKTVNSSISKALKESGIDPKSVNIDFAIKGKKKSVVSKSEQEDDRFDEDEEYDLSDPNELSKAYNKLSDEEKKEVKDKYYRNNLFYVKKKSA